MCEGYYKFLSSVMPKYFIRLTLPLIFVQSALRNKELFATKPYSMSLSGQTSRPTNTECVMIRIFSVLQDHFPNNCKQKIKTTLSQAGLKGVIE